MGWVSYFVSSSHTWLSWTFHEKAKLRSEPPWVVRWTDARYEPVAGYDR